MSKWVTAWGVMTLAQQGRIDLDAPVSRYLTRWRLPPSPYNDAVTVRRLLSHTAGLTDGLGFLGYGPSQRLPGIEEELTHATDAQPGASGITRVGAQPTNAWRYSGGGYLILQLLIEEVSHQPFNDYMQQAVLKPLGMTGSTFVGPDPARLADNFAADGSKIAYARFAALSAASLYTSASDMTRFVQAQAVGPNGEAAGRGVLTPATLTSMRAPTAFLYGLPVWGLGEVLYAPNAAGGHVVGHDGGNAPAINTTARIDPASGEGLVVLETGNATLASQIGGEWTFWMTGIVGFDTLVRFDALSILLKLGAGITAILAAGAWVGWRWGRGHVPQVRVP